MRRVLALTVCALVPVALAACSDDNESAFPELSLVDLGTTEVPFEDKCAIDESAAGGSGAPADTTGVAVLPVVPETPEPAGTSEPLVTTEPAGVADTSEPATASLPAESLPTDDTLPTEAPEIEPPDELPTELVRTLLEEGEGPAAAVGDLLLVHYAGVMSEDGTPFDDSYSRGTPFAVTLAPSGEPAGVIDGWNEGLRGARAGDRIRLDIPADLAYGEAGSQGGIPPNTPLTFVIDVVEVVHIEYPTTAPTDPVKTVISEGDADGPAAQRFDTVTLNLALGVPDVAGGDGEDAADAAGSSIPSSEPDEAAATEPPATEPPTTLSDGSEPVTSSEPDAGPVALTGTGTIVFDTYSGDPASGAPASPAEFELVRGATGIAGLDESLEGVRAGDTFQLDLPAGLAFGEQGAPQVGIPENTPISLYVEIVDVAPLPTVDVPAEVPDELQVTEISEGDGPAAAEGDTVMVNYIGVVTETSTRIDANWNGTPETLVLGEGDYVEGFEEGLVGARAGDELQIDIPADLAYGESGLPDQSVPAETALTYLVKVAAVVPATVADSAPTDLELPLSPEPRATTVTTDAEGNTSEIPAELTTTDVVVGTGAEAAMGSTAVVNIYAVCASNGEVLQNTWGDENREFIQLSSGVVMDGLVDGIVGMQVGGRRIIYVPAGLALAGAGNESLGVGPDRDLIFVVDLYGVL